jgi:predicted alpha/beta-fold hydrolase
MWGKFMRKGLKVPTRAEHWTTPDNDTIELRRLDVPDAAPSAPRLLVLHGLEGTIESHYLRGILDLARQRRWPADVLLFRGCNGQLNRARRMYHSGETTDLSFVIDRLVAAEPERDLLLVGFSLGGNVLLKFLGEHGRAVPPQIRAAAAMSVPFDLERGCRHLERGFARVYNRHFLRTLKRKALAKLDRFPDLFDDTTAREAETLYEFDDAVTAPVHGFVDAHDYYSKSSSIRFLHGIAVPTLLLSAYDDPFLPRQVLDDVQALSLGNERIHTEFHAKGGHVGFVSGQSPNDQRFYGEHRMMEFLGQHLAAGSIISP